MNRRIQEATEALSHFFFPAVCQVCEVERAGPGEGFVCGCCALSVGVSKVACD